MQDWSTITTIVILPAIAALGAFSREIFDIIKGGRAARLEQAKTDSEIGAQLRDDLLKEIDRSNGKMDRFEKVHRERDEECQRKINGLSLELQAMREQAESFRIRAVETQSQVAIAQAQIEWLKKQVVELEARAHAAPAGGS